VGGTALDRRLQRPAQAPRRTQCEPAQLGADGTRDRRRSERRRLDPACERNRAAPAHEPARRKPRQRAALVSRRRAHLVSPHAGRADVGVDGGPPERHRPATHRGQGVLPAQLGSRRQADRLRLQRSDRHGLLRPPDLRRGSSRPAPTAARRIGSERLGRVVAERPLDRVRRRRHERRLRGPARWHRAAPPHRRRFLLSAGLGARLAEACRRGRESGGHLGRRPARPRPAGDGRLALRLPELQPVVAASEPLAAATRRSRRVAGDSHRQRPGQRQPAGDAAHYRNRSGRLPSRRRIRARSRRRLPGDVGRTNRLGRSVRGVRLRRTCARRRARGLPGVRARARNEFLRDSFGDDRPPESDLGNGPVFVQPVAVLHPRSGRRRRRERIATRLRQGASSGSTTGRPSKSPRVPPS